MVRIIEINTIQDYITEIEKNEKDFYFRGESSLKYSKIIASAFRKYPVPFSSSTTKIINYQSALKEYYSEIGHELNEIERENFLFYAQHHGLPTPLIDITENPLTALYFACSSNYMEDECVVYAFDKLRFINLLEFNNTDDMTLNNFFFDNQFTLQVLIGISNLDSQKKMNLFIECIENLKHAFCNGFKLNPKLVGTDIEITIIQILNLHDNSEYKSEKEYVEKFKTLFLDFFEIDFKFNNEKKKFKTSLSLKEQEYFFIIHYNTYFSDIDAVIILFLINQQSRKMVGKFINQGTDLSEKNEDYGVVFPLIIMQPSVKFERMKSQEGSFLYQTPHYRGKTDDFIGFTSINSDVKYIIKNKKSLMMNLEKLGISRKTIFPDHDNIAEYLKYKQLIKLK